MSIEITLSKLKEIVGSYDEIFILGKGPSMSRQSYNTIAENSFRISINESSILYKSEAAFFMDKEPFVRSIPSLLEFPRILILPRFLNERISQKESKPLKKKTKDIIKEDFPELLLKSQGIFLFNEGTKDFSEPVFNPRLVSTTSLLEILFYLGFSRVNGIGFDGGTSYNKELSKKFTTTLVNTFSNQFYEFKKLEIMYNSTFRIMNKETFNIYVGTTNEQIIPYEVLKNSILTNTEHNVSVFRLDEAIKNKGLKLESVEGGTPFSLQRFYIPALNDFHGIAIYLDSDMLVFDDIVELYRSHQINKTLCSCPAPPNSKRRDQYSVFTVDCSQANWKAKDIIEQAKTDYRSVMFDFSFEGNKEKCIDWRWNSLEYYDSQTKLIHFTDMDKQPWIDVRNKNRNVWLNALKESITNGWINYDQIESETEKGNLRPGLLVELRNPTLGSRMNDFFYLPPHTIRRFPQFKFFGGKYLLSFLIKLKRILNPRHDK